MNNLFLQPVWRHETQGHPPLPEVTQSQPSLCLADVMLIASLSDPITNLPQSFARILLPFLYGATGRFSDILSGQYGPMDGLLHIVRMTVGIFPI